MIYILIMVFMIDRGGTTVVAEFNSLEACMTAGKEISKQPAQRYDGYITQVKSVCVPKGEKK